jgi:hypothetical protein
MRLEQEQDLKQAFGTHTANMTDPGAFDFYAGVVTSTEELQERIDASWRRLRPRLAVGQLDARLADGLSVKETLAGIAFWNETVAPVFAWMRGQPEPPPAQWYGGADLGLGDGQPWPNDEVHRTREAAWARAVSDGEVLTRLDRAHERAVAAVATLTADEFSPGPGPAGTTGIDPAHPWAQMTSNERMISKVDSCTYSLYDVLLEQLP